MRIGIDIDDTIANTVDSMLYYADKYDIEVLGKTGCNGNMGLIKDRFYLKELYGWEDDVKYNFFETNYKNVLLGCTPKPDAVEVINKLKKEGHEMYYITARLSEVKDCNAYEITENWLKENNFPIDYLKVNASEKTEICKENNISLLIDDSFNNCEDIKKIGIKSILMTTLMNKDIDSKDIYRAKDWYDVYNYINKEMQ